MFEMVATYYTIIKRRDNKRGGGRQPCAIYLYTKTQHKRKMLLWVTFKKKADICRGLGPFSSNTTSQLNVFGHDGYSLGMDSTEISVLKQTNKIGFRCLLHYNRIVKHTSLYITHAHTYLESTNGSTLEPQISFKVLSNFTNKSLEWKLTDQKFG